MVDATPQEPAPRAFATRCWATAGRAGRLSTITPSSGARGRNARAGSVPFLRGAGSFFLPELARAVAIGITHAGDTEAMRYAEETAIVVGREPRTSTSCGAG